MPVCLTTSPLHFFGTLDVLTLPELLGVADSLAPCVRVELLYAGGDASALILAGGAVVAARFGALRGLRAALAALAQQPVGFTARAIPARPGLSAWALPALLNHARALTELELAELGRFAARAGAVRDDRRGVPSHAAEAAEASARSADHPWRAARWTKLRRS